jgi:hypothetical protein
VPPLPNNATAFRHTAPRSVQPLSLDQKQNSSIRTLNHLEPLTGLQHEPHASRDIHSLATEGSRHRDQLTLQNEHSAIVNHRQIAHFRTWRQVQTINIDIATALDQRYEPCAALTITRQPVGLSLGELNDVQIDIPYCSPQFVPTNLPKSKKFHAAASHVKEPPRITAVDFVSFLVFVCAAMQLSLANLGGFVVGLSTESNSSQWRPPTRSLRRPHYPAGQAVTEPLAFLSYTRKDDEFFGRYIITFPKALENAVRVVSGDKTLRVFQDLEDIVLGEK